MCGTYGQMGGEGVRGLAPVNVTVCVRGRGGRDEAGGGLDVAGRRHKGGLIVNTHSESSESAANKPFINAA